MKPQKKVVSKKAPKKKEFSNRPDKPDGDDKDAKLMKMAKKGRMTSNGYMKGC